VTEAGETTDLLPGGIPKRELDMLAIDLDVCDVVLEDGGHVDLLVANVVWVKVEAGGAKR